MGSGPPAKISAIPEHLYRYTDSCTPADKALTGWVNSNLPDLISVYSQLCDGPGAPAGLSFIVSQVTAQTSAAHATDTRVAEVGHAIEKAGTGVGPVDGPHPAMYTVASEAAVTTEMQKLHDKAEYQAGAHLAEMMAGTRGYSNTATEFLAQHAESPYYLAGLLNNLNAEQLADILPGPLSTGPAPPRIAQAIYTAMADDTLSSHALHELALVLASPQEYIIVHSGFFYPLLKMIAENRDASARLIASMNKNPPLIKHLLASGGFSGNENSVLQIMANAIYAAPSQQAAEALTNSLIQDLSALGSDTISQSIPGLLIFMNAAVSRLIPPGTIADWQDLNLWEVRYWEHESIMVKLVKEIGQAFKDHADNVEFARGLGISVVLAFFPEAIPEEILGGSALAGALAKVADGSVDYVNDAQANELLDLVFGAPEDGREAEYSINLQLLAIITACGITSIYRHAHDSAGLTALYKKSEFKPLISAMAAGKPIDDFLNELATWPGPIQGNSVTSMIGVTGLMVLYNSYTQENN